jgi:tRNA pseudouridine38-40 synthase
VDALLVLAQREATAEEAAAVLGENGRVPKRKVALLISYSGTGFHGMQKQGGLEADTVAEQYPTIELALEKALFAAGGILKSNFGQLTRIGWQRCARTDKGVHALGQVVSVKLLIAPGLLPRVNAYLPDSIHVHALQRVPNSFNARTACDARTYVYALPTVVLSPDYAKGLGRYHRLNERERLAACVRACRVRLSAACAQAESSDTAETAERTALDAAPTATESATEPTPVASSSASPTSSASSPLSSGSPPPPSLSASSSSASAPSSLSVDQLRAELAEAEAAVGAHEAEALSVEHTPEDIRMLAEYRIDEATRQHVCETLRAFVGSHNFWNYTSGKQPTDRSAVRFVHSWDVSESFLVDGVEFVNLRVRGQSFILHQIRKMVCMAVDLMREGGPRDVIDASFCEDLKLTLDLAPGECLMLRHCHFDQYFTRRAIADRTPLTFDDAQPVIEAFQRSVVLPEIAQLIKEGLFAAWLHRHRYYHYPLAFDQWVESTRDSVERSRARALRTLERKRAQRKGTSDGDQASGGSATSSSALGKRAGDSSAACPSASKRPTAADPSSRTRTPTGVAAVAVAVPAVHSENSSCNEQAKAEAAGEVGEEE